MALELAEFQPLSAALVAIIKQVPVLSAVSVAEVELLDSKQPLAVPPVTA
jgi:hypothetical protein